MSDGKRGHGSREPLKQGLQLRGYGQNDQGAWLHLYEVSHRWVPEVGVDQKGHCGGPARGGGGGAFAMVGGLLPACASSLNGMWSNAQGTPLTGARPPVGSAQTHAD